MNFVCPIDSFDDVDVLMMLVSPLSLGQVEVGKVKGTLIPIPIN